VKSLFILFCFLFSNSLFSSFAFSSERIFDCAVKKTYKIQHLPEEFELNSNSKVIFRQAVKNWSLQVGQYGVRDNDGMGPAVRYAAEVSPDFSTVSYYFQLDGSLEFQLSIDTLSHNATLFWWGLGEATPMAKLQCEVSEL